MTDQPDVLAGERFRTILADAITSASSTIDRGDYDEDLVAPGAGADSIVVQFPEARFEHRVNEHGVAVRRVVVASGWEVDPVQPQHEGRKVHGSAGCPVCDPASAVARQCSSRLEVPDPPREPLVYLCIHTTHENDRHEWMASEPAVRQVARHEFVPVRYKGRQEAGCGHLTRTSSHEGRMCGLPLNDPAHNI